VVCEHMAALELDVEGFIEEMSFPPFLAKSLTHGGEGWESLSGRSDSFSVFLEMR